MDPMELIGRRIMAHGIASFNRREKSELAARHEGVFPSRF
jgi:hypothetical protein